MHLAIHCVHLMKSIVSCQHLAMVDMRILGLVRIFLVVLDCGDVCDLQCGCCNPWTLVVLAAWHPGACILLAVQGSLLTAER